ncbi:hypothetical protein FRACA_1960009 [Frankia canadensis]|uniref:Uncharacterized protein n=1 Tax=Frankia canadensis TaxID=1836972 RepID=A0A2I2KPJ9_9ACTN|nr:hypothetical protein FRACA_1960009 [Frankia canadensis]SOU54860.1 hypothetical protein FRACA_1960009 [Frankia canadensis]
MSAPPKPPAARPSGTGQPASRTRQNAAAPPITPATTQIRPKRASTSLCTANADSLPANALARSICGATAAHSRPSGKPATAIAAAQISPASRLRRPTTGSPADAAPVGGPAEGGTGGDPAAAGSNENGDENGDSGGGPATDEEDDDAGDDHDAGDDDDAGGTAAPARSAGTSRKPAA